MPMSSEEIKTHILTSFPDAHIEVEDLAGDNDHFRVIIKSDHFKGLSKIKQHQAVYKAFGGKAGTELHALSLSTAPLT